MSGVSLRSEGARKFAPSRARDLIGPALGLSTGERPGESRLNYKQISAIEQLFNTHPAIQAARTILHGQLFSGGIVLKRNGDPIELKPAFKAHLEEIWVPFARMVVDSFLKFGYATVVYEDDEESLARQSIKRRRTEEGKGKGKGKAVAVEEPINTIPCVPHTSTYEVAYVQAGRAGYIRKYLVYGLAPSTATRIDDEARVYMRQHPDSVGNVNSPMSTIFDIGSFVSALTELAMKAEVANTRPRIWTQLVRENKVNGLDPQALFFDSESRGVAASADGVDNAQNAAALTQMQQMMGMINKLQTTHATQGEADINLNSFSGSGSSTAKTSHVPPEIAPSLFVLPKVRTHLLRNALYIRTQCLPFLTPCAHFSFHFPGSRNGQYCGADATGARRL